MSTSANLPNAGAVEGLAESRTGTRALTPTSGAGLPATVGKRGMRPRPEILTSRPTPLGLLNAYRRRFWLATILGLLFAAGVAAALYFLVPAKWQAAARIQVYSRQPYVMNPVGPTLDAESNRRTTQLQMKLDLVLRDALEDTKVSRSKTLAGQADAIAWLDKNLEVDYVNQSEFLRVALRGDNPADLPVIVNAVVNSYFKLIVDTARVEQQQRREAIKSSYDANMLRLDDFTRQIMTESEKAGVLNTESARVKLRLETEKLERIAGDIERDRQQLRTIELEVNLLENKKKGSLEIPDELLDMEVERSAGVSEILKKLDLLDAEIGRAQTIYRNANAPQIVRLYQQKASLQGTLQEFKKKIREEIVKRIKLGQPATQATGGRSIEEWAAQAKLIAGRMANSQADFEKQRLEVEKMGNSTALIERLSQQRDALRKITDEQAMLLERYNIEANAAPPAKLVESAKEPKERDSLMFKYAAVGFGALVSFSLVTLGIAFMEFQARRVDTATEVTDELGLRHVGDLPEFSGLQLGRLLTFRARSAAKLQDLMSESVDSIRMGLIHQAAALGHTPVVVVTSAGNREGKSTLATRLAVSLANSGRRTLLIDGNLRDPHVHQAFNVAGEPGLCDLLRDPSLMLAHVVNDVDIPGLSVIAAGQCDETSFNAIARGGLAGVLEAARQEFGFVVVDGAATLPVADALAFAEKADYALVCARRDVTKIPDVYETCERLKAVGSSVLGVVVSGTI